jgi:hypothetical protein
MFASFTSRGTRTRRSGSTSPPSRTTGWKLRAFTSLAASASWDGSPPRTIEAPDLIPLIDAAAGIIQHMNADHAAALRSIARHYSGEVADEAAMTAVDRLGFRLRLKSGERVHGRRVAFLQEVMSSEDARSVLVEMVRQARAGAPQS